MTRFPPALSPLEYDTKSNFLNMGAQNGAHGACKALKIKENNTSMLQKNLCSLASVKAVTP